MIPVGIDEGCITVRPIVSAIQTKTAPISTETGNNIWFLEPTNLLAKCGEIKPTKLIFPTYSHTTCRKHYRNCVVI